jgi:hypothetical protein
MLADDDLTRSKHVANLKNVIVLIVPAVLFISFYQLTYDTQRDV